MGWNGSKQLSIRDVDLELWDIGSGRPLVFLHAGDGINEVESFVHSLRMPYRIVMPSHPGFGGTSLPSTYSTVADLSYFYLDLFDHLQLSDVLLVGASFGAWIAAEIAIKRPRHLAGIILADAVGAKFSDRTTREIADPFSTPRHNLEALLYHDENLRKANHAERSKEELLRLARNNESFALYGWAPTLYDPKLKQRLHRIDVPTHVVWGEHDRVVPVEYGRRFAAEIPGATFEVIPEVGHYPHREQPAMFAQAIDRFSSRLGAKDS